MQYLFIVCIFELIRGREQLEYRIELISAEQSRLGPHSFTLSSPVLSLYLSVWVCCARGQMDKENVCTKSDESCCGISAEQKARISQKFRAAKALLARKRPLGETTNITNELVKG